MSRISVLLKDLPADKTRGKPSVRHLLSKDQWDEVLAADARGVSSKAIFAALSGVVTPFFKDPKQFANSLVSERAFRRKHA